MKKQQIMPIGRISLYISLFLTVFMNLSVAKLSYPIVDTGQIRCYSDTLEIAYPRPGAAFFGQDAQYDGNQPAYQDNGDGTVTDLNTGLMWIQKPLGKMTQSQAAAGASKCKVAGYTDWQLPTIKELYSLILFSGLDPDPSNTNTSGLRPFIDTRYFKFNYGDPEDGDRIIDSQFATSTIYRSTTMGGSKTMFGVNFADGRIKGYPVGRNRGPRGEKTYYVLYVRGNTAYGKNNFVDNGDGTVTDRATGLTWMKTDSGKAMNWSQALKYAENLNFAGHSDWRLPNAKELQSIVDYTRCPDVTDSAAIDPVFEVTAIKNEGGQKDYAHYWTGTSHCRSRGAQAACYIAFGRALGCMENRRTGSKTLMDVHGAGAQRSDDKAGDPSRFSQGRGPQGDVVRIYNYVRCVRGGAVKPRTSGPTPILTKSSRPERRGKQQNGQQDIQRGNQRGRSERRPSGADFVRRLDKNGDSKVSRNEFDGPTQHFDRLDRNNDGYLSENEAPQGPPLQRGNRRQ